VRAVSLDSYNTASGGGGVVTDINDNSDGTWMTAFSGGGSGTSGNTLGIASFDNPGITGKEITNITVYFRYKTDAGFTHNGTPYYVRYSTQNPASTTDASWIATTVPPLTEQTAITTVSDTIDISTVGWNELASLDVMYYNGDNGGTDDVYIYDIWIVVTYDSTPPAAITKLTALTGSSGGEINLSWSAPGDDEGSGTLGTALNNAQFNIEYTSVTADAQNPFW